MFFLNPRPSMINSSRPRFVASPWKNATTKDSQQQRPLAQHRDANVCAPARACTCTCSREREREKEKEPLNNPWMRPRIRIRASRVRSTGGQSAADNDPLSACDKDTAANWRDPPWLEYTPWYENFPPFFPLSFFSSSSREAMINRRPTLVNVDAHRPLWRKNAGSRWKSGPNLLSSLPSSLSLLSKNGRNS